MVEAGFAHSFFFKLSFAFEVSGGKGPSTEKRLLVYLE